MKVPPDFNFEHTDGNVFRLTHNKVPGARVDVHMETLELGVLYVLEPESPGTFVKRVPTSYCLQLARGILNYWTEVNGTEGVPGDN